MQYVLSVSILLIFFYLRRKLNHLYSRVEDVESRIVNESTKLHMNNYAQLEDLIAIYNLLKIEKCLPKTRNWAASPDFLRILATHVLQEKPFIVVECGSGVSTFVLARCLQINGKGHLYSLEHDRDYAEKTKINLSSHGLKDWATVICAPLAELALQGERYVWYTDVDLPETKSIDMLVVDGPPALTCVDARYPAGPVLAEGSENLKAIFLHDTDREDEQRIIERWRKEMSPVEVIDLMCEKGAVRLNFVC